jgi:hypothetical protein
MSVKKQLLDPLGTICKLISLNFSEINTKISIHNHVLTLHRPNNLQSVVRIINGDGRENISELFYIIVKVIKWYLSGNIDENEPEENWTHIARSDELKKIITYVCYALRRLQETYEYGNVILAIQFYINILEDSIHGYYNDNKLPNYIIDKEKEFENLLDYEKLKNFWDYKKLKRICDLYDNCFSVFNDQEMPTSEKEGLVNGYLNSINAVLTVTDTEFQKLLNNSSRG